MSFIIWQFSGNYMEALLHNLEEKYSQLSLNRSQK